MIHVLANVATVDVATVDVATVEVATLDALDPFLHAGISWHAPITARR